MLRAFVAFSGTFPVARALKLAPMLFVRPGELRQAKCEEIDLERGEWRYRVSKTKTDHLVPLSTQAVSLLRELLALTGGAHAVPDALGAAYNRTRFIKERRAMMQTWADYLDQLKKGQK